MLTLVGKKAKDRITVALCASMSWEKMKPFVIGRCRQQRCFKKVEAESLPVTYSHTKKVWMNSQLFHEWITSVDKKMCHQKRKIQMFLDNASSHQDLQFTNVKLVKLPANCTSVLQPMEVEVLQATQHLISRMNTSTLRAVAKQICCRLRSKNVAFSTSTQLY